MAHYAFLDENNIVTDVIVGKDENDLPESALVAELPEGVEFWEHYYGNIRNATCKRTSYNTFANSHSGGGNPFRGNYAGIGFEYRADLDAFVPPMPDIEGSGPWIFDTKIMNWTV